MRLGHGIDLGVATLAVGSWVSSAMPLVQFFAAFAAGVWYCIEIYMWWKGKYDIQDK